MKLEFVENFKFNISMDALKKSFIRGNCSALYLIGALKITIAQKQDFIHFVFFILWGFMDPSKYLFKDSKVIDNGENNKLVDWNWMFEKLVFVIYMFVFREIIFKPI